MKALGLGVLGALIGVGLFVIGRHLYVDHANLHTLVLLVQQAQAAKR